MTSGVIISGIELNDLGSKKSQLIIPRVIVPEVGLEQFLLFVPNMLISIHCFSCISYTNLKISEKGMNPFLILNTLYTYRGCRIKPPDLPSKK